MEELIFIALIFFFSLIESIARKKKQQRGGSPEIPGEWEAPDEDESWRGEGRTNAEADAGSARRTQERSAPRGRPRTRRDEGSGATMPTYDSDTSYDQETLDEAASSREVTYSPTPPKQGQGARPSAPSSEGMIPADLWKEIEKLARGQGVEVPEAKPAPKPRPAPKPAPSRAPVPTRSSTTRAGPTPRGKYAPTPSKAPPVPRRAEGHAVHRAHEGFGTDPSERAPSAQDRLDPLQRVLNPDAAAARKQLMARDRSSLRQAVIIQEILSPPVALRDEPGE